MNACYRRAVLGLMRWALVLVGAGMVLSELFGDLEDER